MKTNMIHLGDCLELMVDIPDQSIDMILCDLPYGITSCKWDSRIPFDQLWAHYKRIIKPKGAIVLTASQPFTSALVMSNPKWFRCEWIWEKDNGTNFLDVNRKPFKVHESVLVFGKNSPTYYPQMTTGQRYNIKVNTHVRERLGDKNLKRIDTLNSGTRFPRTIVRFPSITSLPTEKGLHPTQKPVALFEYLIKTYTKEGETVLDNCAGSGTTAVACLNTKRNYICIEKDTKYFNVMLSRVKNYQLKI